MNAMLSRVIPTAFVVIVVCVPVLEPLKIAASPVGRPAPPPKPVVGPGRIALWAGDKVVDFDPDGRDSRSIDVPNLKDAVTPYAFVTPDRKTIVYRKNEVKDDYSPFTARLAFDSRTAPGSPRFLDGYVPARFILSWDGTGVYFWGPKAKEMNADNWNSSAVWHYNLASKVVTKLPLPTVHILLGVTRDGGTFFTGRLVGKDGSEGWSSSLVSADGKNVVEAFGRKVWVDMVAFSPSGEQFVAFAVDFESLKPVHYGGHTFEGQKLGRPVLYHRATKEEVVIPSADAKSKAYRFAWSPDGSQIAVLWNTESGLAVTVSSPDGSNSTEVYKGKADPVMAFEWR